MGVPAPHKVVLKELIERLEAAVARLEGLSPPTALPPPDAAAIEAADRMIAARKHELMDAPYE